jgi:mannose-6-phosphate isomerase
MIQRRLYPLRFEPICQYRLWGGRRLADLLTVPLPGEGPFGEAWLLSDRQDHLYFQRGSRVVQASLHLSTLTF